MAGKVALAVLALAAAVLLVLALQGGEPEMAGGAPAAGTDGEETYGPGPALRQGVDLPEPEPEAGSGTATGAAEAGGATSGPPATTGPALRLAVFDRVSRQPLADFRYQWRQDGERRTGAGTQGIAQFEVAPDRPGSLLVEAEGHEPESREGLAPPPGQQVLELSFYLAPLPELVGVELTVRDPTLAPVPRVRVDAFRLQPGETAAAARSRAPLWSRRAEQADGVYRLPELSPGRYLLRVLAIDDAGDVLPLLPRELAVDFGGTEHLPLLCELQPGALLSLEVSDLQGQPAGKGLQVRLTDPGGAIVPVLWLATANDQRLAARNALPAAGRATTAEPLPPGRYRIELLEGGELLHRAWLDLAPGQRHEEHMALPLRR